MSLGSIFPQIYFEKFGKSSFILTPLGFIYSRPVYLNLEDLNLLNDLGHILDFYRNLDFEGSSLNIKVPGSYGRESFCNCLRKIMMQPPTGIVYNFKNEKIYCQYCDELICDLCLDKHSNHITKKLYLPKKETCKCCGNLNKFPYIHYKSGKMTCLNCVPFRTDFLEQTDPIINFNLAEWIPIKGFLENRNINSTFFGRKIRYQLEYGIPKFNLIHKKVEYNLDAKTTLIFDQIYRVEEKYNIPEILTEIILDYLCP